MVQYGWDMMLKRNPYMPPRTLILSFWILISFFFSSLFLRWRTNFNKRSTEKKEKNNNDLLNKKINMDQDDILQNELWWNCWHEPTRNIVEFQLINETHFIYATSFFVVVVVDISARVTAISVIYGGSSWANCGLLTVNRRPTTGY